MKLYVDSLESTRKELQQSIDSQKTLDERNKLGQYATPSELANDIVREVLGYLPNKNDLSFLEPAIGSGAFYSALLNNLEGARINSALGIEIDERFADVARSIWGDNGIKIVCSDFTKMNPEDFNFQTDLLIANPPYVRHHHIDSELKKSLQIEASKIIGKSVSGLSGLYVYFLLLAHRWLAKGAISAWLIPTEWMDVNYGHALRDYLTKQVKTLRIHKFSADDVQFTDALVSSSVVIFENSKPAADDSCLFTGGSSLENPIFSRKVNIIDLSNSKKWSSKFIKEAKKIEDFSIRLGDIFGIRRGIATGCNDFFIRPHEEFKKLGIPDEFLKPILPPTKKLGEERVIRSNKNGYPLIETPLSVFHSKHNEEYLKEHYPRVFNFLNSPEAEEAKSGYLSKNRKPWYSQEERPIANIVCTYMGRMSSTNHPFRFYLNLSQAIVSNSYLILSLKPEYNDILVNQPNFLENIVNYLNNLGSQELCAYGRVYGGGLYKLEPKELSLVPLRGLDSIINSIKEKSIQPSL